MKKNIFNTFGLLFCACGLITGCYNGWSTNGTPKPSSEPEPVVSSSSEPEELPVEDFQVDLSYPLKDTPIVPLTKEEFRKEVIDSTGSAMVYESINNYLGDYFIDFILEHNHMTVDEVEKLISSLWDFAMEVDNDDSVTYHCVYNLAYSLAYIDADRLFATMKEVFDDRVAWGYLVNVFCESYYTSDYINTDHILKGSNSTIHNLAEKERKVLGANPYAVCNEPEVRFLAEIGEMENGHVFFRFLHRFFRSMIRHLDVKEIAFILYNTALTSVADEEDLESCQEYVYGEGIDSLLRFVHHIGAWLSELNINGRTYEACYPAFYNVFTFVIYSTYDLLDTYLIDSEWIEKTLEIGSSLFEELNPEGLRALFKFVGLVCENCTAEQLAIIMGASEEPDVNLIVDLYNEQYGMLTASEKVGMTEAAAAFGVDFDLVIEKLKEWANQMSDPEASITRDDSGDDEGGSIEDILNEYIVGKFMEKFTFEAPVFFSGDRYAEYGLIYRQGQTVTNQMLEEYLTSGVCPTLGIIEDYFYNRSIPMRDDHYSHYVYEERDNNGKLPNRVLKNVIVPVDTSTCGVKELKFTMTTKVNFHGVEENIEATLTMVYHIVPSDTDTIFGVPYGASLYYGNNWTYRNTYIDSSGNKFAYHSDMLYVELNKTYTANEYSVRIEGGTALRIFDDDLQRFVSAKNKQYYSVKSDPLWLNNLDTSSLGVHTSLVNLNYYDGYVVGSNEYTLFGTMKCCVRYCVVNSIYEIPGTPMDAPIA